MNTLTIPASTAREVQAALAAVRNAGPGQVITPAMWAQVLAACGLLGFHLEASVQEHAQ